MAATKFYKTIITVTVITEDTPISSELSLSDIEEEFTNGDAAASMDFSSEEISSAQAAEELMKTGSSPEFFGLTEDVLSEDLN